MSETSILMTSVGGYLPERVVTNQDLSATVDTSDEWIRQRTGITQLRLCEAGQVEVEPQPQTRQRQRPRAHEKCGR